MSSYIYICISGRDIQKVIPSVVILRERRGRGGESFVGVLHSQRYNYSSSGTFTVVHIQLRYVSTVNAVGGPFYFRSQAVRRGCPFVINTAVVVVHFTAVHIELRYVSSINAVGGPFCFRSQAGRRGCPSVVCLSLNLAIALEGLRGASLTKKSNYSHVCTITTLSCSAAGLQFLEGLHT